MGVSWLGAERTSPAMSGDGAVAVIGGLVMAGGAAIGCGCAIAGLGRVTSAGRGATSSGSVRLASTLASAARTLASNGFRWLLLSAAVVAFSTRLRGASTFLTSAVVCSGCATGGALTSWLACSGKLDGMLVLGAI
jgi:hypothetical protein